MTLTANSLRDFGKTLKGYQDKIVCLERPLRRRKDDRSSAAAPGSATIHRSSYHVARQLTVTQFLRITSLINFEVRVVDDLLTANADTREQIGSNRATRWRKPPSTATRPMSPQTLLRMKLPELVHPSPALHSLSVCQHCRNCEQSE
jgi:hypothetical protein